MSADEAMQPESMADELENVAPPGDLEDAAQQQDSDANPDSASEPNGISEDVAEPPVESVSEEDADFADESSAATDSDDVLDDVSKDELEDSTENTENIAADAPDAHTSDLSNSSALTDTPDEVSEYAAASETATHQSELKSELNETDEEVFDRVADTEISGVSTTGAETEESVNQAASEPAETSDASEASYESLAESSATLAESEAEEIEEIQEEITEEAANASAAESDLEPDAPAQNSEPETEPENVAAPPLTPSIPVQILQTVQTIVGIVLPILRVATVLTLKLTIRVLQLVVDLLDEPKPEPSISDQSPTNAASTTQAAPDPAWNPESRTGAIAYSMADLTNTEMGDEDAEVKRVRFTIDDIYQDDGSLRPLPERLKEIWQDLIRVMRAPLPTAMNQQIPDKVFSFILAAVLVIVIWNLVTFILPSKPSPRLPQATKPQPTEVAKPSATKEPAIDTPTEPTPAPDIAQPAPTPTVQPTPTPTATPQLELEPRDTVIEAIQQQVSEVTQRYADNLIQSVQANFRDGRLTVRVSDDWYRLEANQQDQVATDLLKRTKSLDFGKLELLDSQDTRVARSPIVGNKMLILQRDRTDITGPIGTTATETAKPSNLESDTAEPKDSLPVTSPVTSTNEV